MTTDRPKNSNVSSLRGSRIMFQASPLSARYSILIEKVKSRATIKKLRPYSIEGEEIGR